MSKLPTGYELIRDDDGDWLLIPPRGVTIFSETDEPLLIGDCDYETALTDALAFLEATP